MSEVPGMLAKPRNAREMLLFCRELGHLPAIEQRGPWPEKGDPHPKFYVSCSCGWKSTVRRTRATANSVMSWHLGNVYADHFEPRRVNGA